jgi:hypothetical protein
LEFLFANTKNIFSGGEYLRILSSYYPLNCSYAGGSGDILYGVLRRNVKLPAAKVKNLLNFIIINYKKYINQNHP